MQGFIISDGSDHYQVKKYCLQKVVKSILFSIYEDWS